MTHAVQHLAVLSLSFTAALAFLPSARAEEPLRELSTDRPDTTESAHTVDAGHFQAEIDVVRATRDERLNEYSYLSSNLKLGLTSFWDFQVIVDSLVGVPPPREGDDARPGGSSKRCSNARLRRDGYRFEFPTYREGYRAVLDAEPGRGL